MGLRAAQIKKAIGAALCAFYFSYCVLNPEQWHIVNWINLVFHEAGHTLLFFFGDFVHVLGGTLFQIGIPLGIVFYYLRNREYFSAAIILMWVGQAFVDVSIYAGDAIRQELPLLGGENAEHDWFNMLSDLGILHHTNTVAFTLETMGFVILTFSILWAFYNVFNLGAEGGT
jgi:voltage-gated potassium channel Kch